MEGWILPEVPAEVGEPRLIYSASQISTVTETLNPLKSLVIVASRKTPINPMVSMILMNA